MFTMTLRDMAYRARRYLVVGVAMSIVFTLLYLMDGLVEQFNQEPYLTVDAIGAEIWVLPAGSSGPFTSSATLSAAQVDAASVDPALTAVVVARGTLTEGGQAQETLVIGHPVDGIGAPPTVAGAASGGAGQLVVDRTSGVAVGDEVRIGDRRFTVAGLSADTTLLAGLPVVFMPIADARDALFGGRPVVSALVTDAPLQQVPDGLTPLTADEVAADALGPLESAVASIDLIRALLWFMAATIVGGVLYLTVLERQRDFAVLKALGGTNRQLLRSLALQATAITVVAVAIASLLQSAIAPWFPLTVRVPTSAFWQVPLVAIIVAIVATRAGSARVRSADPVSAFGGPG
jgi:putative ABC transport system permease protein